MAPEQAQGKELDGRCDLFSLGCVLYRMATGQPPFRGTDIISTLMAVATETPRPPQMLEPGLPRTLSNLIMGLLAKEAADRPASAQVVVEKLGHIVQELSRPAPAKPRRRWPTIAAAAAVLALLAATVVFFMQTPDGTVRIEIDDPQIKLAIEGHTATITNADKQPITLKPGKHGLTITRGDFTFNTASFELPRRGKTALTITWHPGQKMTVTQDGVPIGEKAVPVPPVASGALPPLYKNSLGMEFVLVPKGKSWLGGGGGKPGNKEVEMSNDFYLGKYEVTQEEWQKVMGNNPSEFQSVPGISREANLRFPVEKVSWDDCQRFVRALNDKVKEAGWSYRLPWAVEWEYACRGGPMKEKDDSPYRASDYYFEMPTIILLPAQANFATADGTGLKRTCKVGDYQPNRLGLYDMHGNVWEWCQDEMETNERGLLRVHLGGSWSWDATCCQASFLGGNDPWARHNYIGMRLARVPAGKETVKISAEVHVRVNSPTADPDRRAAGWVISVGGAVQVNESTDYIGKMADLPAGPLQLKGIQGPPNKVVPPGDWEIVRGCKNLTSLDLGFTKISDEALANFKDCKKLMALTLSGPNTDAGLAHFKDCKDLAHLSFYGLEITPDALAPFKNCKNLRYLDMRAMKVDAAGLAHFKGSLSLTQLNLGSTGIRDDDLVPFSTCPNLTAVTLSGNKVTDAGLAHFKSCRKLDTLDLRGTPIDDDGLLHLKEFRELRVILVQGTKVTANGAKRLAAELPKCRILWEGGEIGPGSLGSPKDSKRAQAIFKERDNGPFLKAVLLTRSAPPE